MRNAEGKTIRKACGTGPGSELGYTTTFRVLTHIAQREMRDIPGEE